MPETFDSKAFLGSLTHKPGVYQMLDEAGGVLYVGKARDLKRRVSSYFGSKAHHPKTQALMNQVADVQVTVTASEHEALLLEYNLIKRHTPRFNVVLRDDKSYPYIRVTSQQEFPRFEFHRGSRKAPGRYFGPYPNAGAVRKVLGQLQKLFMVRQCRDSFFANRSRPCLQYQIERCTGPCVGLVDRDSYARDVDNAVRFLEGRNADVLSDLVARMERASEDLDFEAAARLRDQITAIRKVQSTQVVAGTRTRDADVLALHDDAGLVCVSLIMIRGGRVLGSRNLFPRVGGDPAPEQVLAAVIVQHYFAQPAPRELLVSHPVADLELLESALSARSNHQVNIRTRVRGQRRQWLEMASNNAREAAALRRATHSGLRAQFVDLGRKFRLDDVPERIECFDISHTGGEGTVASCVAFNQQGPDKSSYRRYNIKEAAAGDDYGAIAEVVRRRYRKAAGDDATTPDLVLIDGGKGQLGAAMDVLEELQLGGVELAGVAKGVGRKPGREKIYRPGRSQPLLLPASSPAMHLIQQLRDEAHRFAITGHRQRRGKRRNISALEEIRGLGPKRRRALLQQFGGLQGLKRAGIEDLAAVKGISRDLAQRVFEHLHGG
ncbi:MAG: excinuclease ABC subunit UvrC [Gammaproteobacteria bacterium]|nr:excinuclease ABC subunit UvrC [Gammaproteobacteria bacterium]